MSKPAATIVTTGAELFSALSTVRHSIPTRSTLPILSCVRIRIGEAGIPLVAADSLDSFAERMIPSSDATGEEGIGFCIRLSVLESFAKQCGSESLEIEYSPKLERQTVRLSSGTRDARIPVLPIEEFPDSKYKFGAGDNIDPKALHFAISAVAKCASSDPTRYILNGVCLDSEFSCCVAGDGKVMAVAKCELPSSLDKKIVPSGSVNTLLATLSECGADPVTIAISDSNITIQSGTIRFGTKTIEGTYPGYRNVTESRHDRESVVVNRDEFVRALNWCDSSTKSDSHAFSPLVQIESEGDQLTLSRWNKAEAEASTEIPTSAELPAFNLVTRFDQLRLALAHVPDDELRILVAAENPVLTPFQIATANNSIVYTIAPNQPA